MFGYIYVIRLMDSRYNYATQGHQGCSYKIGKTKNLDARLKALGVLMPHDSEIMLIIPTLDMHWAERYLHEKMADIRMNGEWFRLTRAHMEWLTVLHSPLVGDLIFENQKEFDNLFSYYVTLDFEMDHAHCLSN